MKYALYLAVLATMFVSSRLSFAEGTGVGGMVHMPNITGGVGRPSGDGLMALGFTTGTGVGSIGRNAGVSTSVGFPSTVDDYSSTGGGKRMVGGRAPGYDDVAGGKTHNPQGVRGIGTTIASPGGRGH